MGKKSEIKAISQRLRMLHLGMPNLAKWIDKEQRTINVEAAINMNYFFRDKCEILINEFQITTIGGVFLLTVKEEGTCFRNVDH